ncbi:MAG TPA: hypothetical protein PK625_05550 [Spirochaetales bacterium]|nr:hypothetical protein [Spirochaetales bacterium]
MESFVGKQNSAFSNGTSKTVEPSELSLLTKYLDTCKRLNAITEAKETGYLSAAELRARLNGGITTLKGSDYDATSLLGDLAGMEEDYDEYLKTIDDADKDTKAPKDVLTAVNMYRIWAERGKEEAADGLRDAASKANAELADAQRAHAAAYNAYLAANDEDKADALTALEATAATYSRLAGMENAYWVALGSVGGQTANIIDTDNTAIPNADEFTDRYGAEIRSIAAADFSRAVLSLNELRERSHKLVRMNEWTLRKDELNDARDEWSAMTAAVQEAGRVEFAKARKTIQKAYEDWLTEFETRYAERSLAWDLSYQEAMEAKQAWVNKATAAADAAGNEAMAASLGMEAAASARELDLVSVSSSWGDASGATGMVQGLLAATGITQAADAIAALNSGIARIDTKLRTTLDGETAWDSYQVAALVQSKVREGNQELAQRMAIQMAEQAQEQLEAAIAAYEEQIKAANQGFESGMDSMFGSAGYQKGDGGYQKDLIVGSTVIDSVVEERVTVRGYQAYEAPDIEFEGLELDREILARMDQGGIMARIEMANAAISRQIEKVLGKPDDEYDR